jgi:TP901 family phage tail tape measure protein
MAEPDINVGINASTNFPSVVQKVVKSVESLENNLQDLVGVLQDMAKVNNQSAQSLEGVGKSATSMSKQVGGSVSDLDKLRDALQKTGAEGDKALKGLDLSKINLKDLSLDEVTKLSQKLREAGTSFGEFILNQGKIDLNFRPAIEQLNELQELLKLPLSQGSDFSSTKEVFAELRRLNQELRNEIEQTLANLKVPDTVFAGVGELRAELAKLSDTGGLGRELNLLIDFEQNRAEAIRTVETIDDLRLKLIELGPAARSGNDTAITEFRQLSRELDSANTRAETLTKTLRGGQAQFASATGSQNQTLQGFGFRPITLEDIFPSEEQRRVDDLRRRIDSAVRESVQAGAVRDTLNTFLRTNSQITGDLDKNVVSLVSHLPRMRYALYDVSNSLAIFSAGFSGAAFATLKFSADFERSFADVARTTGLFGAEAAGQANQLKTALIDLTQDIPVGFEDVAQIATLAGQLNIANDSIAEFTESVAKFAATTDVTVEAAATAFGRLDQLVEGVDGQFEKLGSSILAVGVNAVATESDIIAISTQIASVANIAGFSASELIGFSSALASVGTRPELARGTFTRLFTEIQQSVAEGGTQLEVFARTAGQSQQEFTDAWGAGSGAEQVIAVLKGLDAAGKDADQVLAQLGITSVRDVPTLLKLAQSVEEVERQIQIANLGFAEGSELQNQYSVITSTFSEKLVVLKNNFAALLNTLGSATGFLGIFVDALIGITKALESILDNPVNQFIVGLVSIIVGAVGVLGLLGSAVLRAAGSLVGFATANIETREAVGLMRVSVDQLNGSLVTNSTVTKAATATSRAHATAVGAEAIAANTANNANKGFFATLGGGITKTKLFSSTLVGVGIAVGSIILFSVIDQIYELGKAAGYWGDQADKAISAAERFNQQFGESSTFLQAVQDDTENYLKANEAARDQFDVFSGSVKANNLEISERGEILAVVTGQEELLAGAAGKTANQIQKQTLAIGENTEALIRQKIAQDLANKALEEGIDAAKVDRAVRISQAQASANQQGAALIGARTGASFVDQDQIGIASVFEIVTDPALSERLKTAGFDFQEYVNAVVSGNEEVANSVLADLKPAAEELRNALQAEDAKKYAEQISFLNGVIQFGTPALKSYSGAGSELRESIKQLVFEQKILNGGFEESSESLETFRDALKQTFADIYAPINAQREMEDAVRRLGAAFAEESSSVVINSQEMQNAIFSIIDTASSPEEAIDGLQGLYTAILDGGYASRDELKLLGDQIIETYTIAAQARLQLLKDERSISRSPSEVRTRAQADAQRALDQQIRSQEESIRNIRNIASGTANSAEQANLLAQGYSRAASAAGGTRQEVEKIEKQTQVAVRTLLDYANDIEGVYSRAFDIRFGAQKALDGLADSWENLAETVEDARFQVEELLASQQDLSADRAIKEYFLSIAEAYGDALRAAKLREELAELDRKSIQDQKKLVEAQQIAGGDLTTQGPGARRNREALLALVKNYQDYITSLAESGASQAELTAATERARREFTEQARELGFQEAVILQYAAAFDDVQVAISRVERNITVEANVNPALQALNELNASLQRQIEAANDLNRALNQPVPSRSPSAPATPARVPLTAVLAEDLIVNVRPVASGVVFRPGFVGYSQGGFTGRGGAMDPAGIVHKGEYVIPKQFVNQSTGMPDPSFLAQMQSGMRNYFNGGFVGGSNTGGSEGVMMVELSPYDRKLLADAGNVELRLDGKILAASNNANSLKASQRGTN